MPKRVTLRYQDNRVHSVDTVVVSTQHNPDVSLDALREAVIEEIVKPVMPSHWLTPQTRFLVNPAGSFVIGGPVGDCGLTGRKIIVDTYGGAACHGGGAFSGKDPSKVDRSAAYAARYVAKNIVAAGLASRCEVQLGWAIGLPRPVSVRINTFGTQTVSSEALLRGVNSHFDLSVFGIITTLDLLVPAIVKQPAMVTLVATAFRGKLRTKRRYYTKTLDVKPTTRSTVEFITGEIYVWEKFRLNRNRRDVCGGRSRRCRNEIR